MLAKFGDSGATVLTLQSMLSSSEGHCQRSPAAVTFCNANTSAGDPQIEHHCIHFQLTFHAFKHREWEIQRTERLLLEPEDYFKKFFLSKCKSLLCFQGASHSPPLPAYLMHSSIHTRLCVCFHVLYVPPVPVWVFPRYSRHRSPPANTGVGDSSV